MRTILELCDVVRGTGFAIHRHHRNGHLEKIHENALAYRGSAAAPSFLIFCDLCAFLWPSTRAFFWSGVLVPPCVDFNYRI